MFTIGLIAALAASALFNIGVALQALDAREAPKEDGLRLSLLTRLLRRKRWLFGFFLGAIGFPLEVLAFANAPFVVVQPALAVGLLLLLALGVTLLGEKVTKEAVFGVVAIVAGITLIAWGAPDHVEVHRGAGQVTAVVGVLIALTFLPFALKGTRFDTGMMATIGSAVGFGTSNVTTKLMSDDMNLHHWGIGAVWFALTFITGIAAIVTEMTALQRLPATTVVPVSFAVQTFLPLILEPLFLRERLGSADFHGIPILTGAVVMLFGVVAVARTRAVSLLAGGS